MTITALLSIVLVLVIVGIVLYAVANIPKLESISRLDARVESPHVLANEALAILQGLIGGSHDIR
jgi:hypothetical protein